MKLLKDSKGFTLIETLVAINLSFLAITFIFSFYLFIQKFTDTLSRNYTEKYLIQNFFSSAERTLRQSDSFVVTKNGSILQIGMDQNSSLNVYIDSLSLNNIFNLSKLDRVVINIFMIDGSQLTIDLSDGITNDQFGHEDSSPIKSCLIKSIKLDVEKRAKKYSYEIYLPNTAINRFVNIKTEL